MVVSSQDISLFTLSDTAGVTRGGARCRGPAYETMKVRELKNGAPQAPVHYLMFILSCACAYLLSRVRSSQGWSGSSSDVWRLQLLSYGVLLSACLQLQRCMAGAGRLAMIAFLGFYGQYLANGLVR